MAIISQNISAFGALVLIASVDKTNPASVLAFQQSWEAFNTQLKNTTVSELNTFGTQTNAVRDEVNTLRNTVVDKEALVSPHYTAIDGVHSNSVNINAVNSNSVNINAVNANSVNINSVVSNATNINTVAANETDINSIVTTIVPNIAEILLADTNAATATTKAQLASDYAQKVNATVEIGTYSSKEHAIGDLIETGGSAKAWATDTASPDGTTSKSAKTLAAEAVVSAAAALASENAAAAIFDAFDDRYLGAKATAPTLDNDGNPLQAGAEYLNTSESPNMLYFWDGTLLTWIARTFVPTDHGTLTGRSDDDHTQYHNDTRGDARYYTKTANDILLAAKAPLEDVLGANIASATTTTIGTAGSGSTAHITGVTTITSFGVSTTGTKRTLIFDGALSITQNATSMILPAATSITTAAGDVMEVVCENGALGYWRCTSYIPNVISVTEQRYLGGVTGAIQAQLDGKLGTTLAVALNTARATVASSATTSQIWTALGNQIDWTGTATTTAFPNAPQAGAERTLICAGACSFTAGANMLIDGVVSGATVTCAAGDTVIVRAISTTQFKLTRLKADGTSQVSSVIVPNKTIGYLSKLKILSFSAEIYGDSSLSYKSCIVKVGNFTYTAKYVNMENGKPEIVVTKINNQTGLSILSVSFYYTSVALSNISMVADSTYLYIHMSTSTNTVQIKRLFQSNLVQNTEYSVRTTDGYLRGMIAPNMYVDATYVYTGGASKFTNSAYDDVVMTWLTITNMASSATYSNIYKSNVSLDSGNTIVDDYVYIIGCVGSDTLLVKANKATGTEVSRKLLNASSVEILGFDTLYIYVYVSSNTIVKIQKSDLAIVTTYVYSYVLDLSYGQYTIKNYIHSGNYIVYCSSGGKLAIYDLVTMQYVSLHQITDLNLYPISYQLIGVNGDFISIECGNGTDMYILNISITTLLLNNAYYGVNGLVQFVPLTLPTRSAGSITTNASTLLTYTSSTRTNQGSSVSASYIRNLNEEKILDYFGA